MAGEEWVRHCSACGQDKSVEEFRRKDASKKSGVGLLRNCLTCRRGADKQRKRALRGDPVKGERIRARCRERVRNRRKDPKAQAEYRTQQQRSYERTKEKNALYRRERREQRAPLLDGVSRIYFVLSVKMQRIKIGYSGHHPLLRFKIIQTDSADEVKLLGWMRGSRDDEKRLHDRFAHLHDHREWFRAEQDLLGYIAAHAGQE